MAAGSPPPDRAKAERLRAAAIERLAQLDDDSAFVLYRAARDADPGYFIAQYEYVSLSYPRFRGPEIRRELASGDSTSRLNACLVAAAQVTPYNERPVALLRSLESTFGATPCTDVFLLILDPVYSPARAARAMRDSPGVSNIWSAVSAHLQGAGQWQEADQLLIAGIEAADDPLAKVRLTLARIDQRNVRHDTAGAVAMWSALATDVKRDGRPGPQAAYLAARCIGIEHIYPGDTPESVARICRQFTALVRPHRAWYTEWEVSRWLGKTLLERGELKAAAPVLTRAVELSDSIGTPGLQLISYTERGRAFSKAGQLSLAMRDLTHAVAIGPAAEGPYYFAEAYHNLAHAYEGAGRFAEAATAADSFAAIAAPMAHNSERWISRHDAGMIRWAAGWHAAATKDFDAMVKYVDEQGDGHYFVGEYFERIGELGRALQYYRAGVAAGFDSRNLAALSRVFDALGFPDSAEAAARRHDRETDRWPILERPLLPDVLARHGRVAEAVVLADSWARKESAAGNIQGAALAKLNLARLLLLDHKPGAAHIAAASAESLSHLLRLTAETIEARTLEGRALFEQGKRSAGLAALRDAVSFAAAHPSTGALLSTNLALGNALETAGRGAEALRAYAQAAQSVEKMTAGLDADVDRTGFKSRHLAPFDGALRVLFGAAPANAGATLRWSVQRKAAALALAGEPTKTAPRQLSVTGLRALLRADEALVDFTVLDSVVAAIVVRRESITQIPLTVSPASLSMWIEALRRPLVATAGGRIDLAHAPFDVVAAESLFHVLFAPLGATLLGVSRLAIVPDGALWYVPFAALVTRPQSAGQRRPDYLIDRYELRLLPSALFLSRADAGRALPQGFRVQALNYAVPGGAAEVRAIRTALGTSRVIAFEGAAATERAALSATTEVLHLAAHGVVDDRDPLASHLELAPEHADDGLLHLSEVAGQRRAPRLVVLTACEAVNGKLYAGEGLVGLARAFLVSGAREVIASQWPVDSSAAELTGIFYGELARGRSPSAALRSAQLALQRDPGTAHPIHWGGFVAFEGGGLRSP